MLNKEILKVVSGALDTLDSGFNFLPEYSTTALDDELTRVVNRAAERMADNYPYFHPLYAGQMLKPPHPAAQAAYMLAMWINPNNHALDGGRASSRMEKEAVAGIADMFGWPEHLGHLTGGGTMANLEALWVAGQLKPGKTIVASDQAHYTHSRITKVLNLPFQPVASDNFGRMDLNALEDMLKKNNIGTVVATMGTTAVGAVDKLSDIIILRDKYGFRLHADAAYGGYFILADTIDENARLNFEALRYADSIVIDPHKHGLQPYGCGCVLFRDTSVGRLYKHESPYTYFSSEELHLGEISLECSRAGAAAVALWATMQLLPLNRGGKFAEDLSKGPRAALTLYKKIAADNYFITAFKPELDIVIWIPAAQSVSDASVMSRKIFDECARNNLHLALAELPVRYFDFDGRSINVDADTVTCLRSVLMKPEHEEWIDRINEILRAAVKKI